MNFIIFATISTVILMGTNLLNFIIKIPNKAFAINLFIFGIMFGYFCIRSPGQISTLGIIFAILLYSIYVLLYVYILDIVYPLKIYKIIKSHKDIKLDGICVMIGYTMFTNVFVIVTIVFFKRYNEVNNFNNFNNYIYFIILSASMLIESLLLVISLIRLCYKTEFEISIFKQFFLLAFLIIICIFSFAILNTSLNCIDIVQEKVIIQDDYFIDYIYRYTCIFTLQYSSSDDLSQIDKILNIIALIYSYSFIATIINLIINSFSTKKEKMNYIPRCPTCSSDNIEIISTTKKMIGGAKFRLFSSDVRNTMHCKNCGYKW